MKNGSKICPRQGLAFSSLVTVLQLYPVEQDLPSSPRKWARVRPTQFPPLLSKTPQHRPQFQERPLPLGEHCTDQLPDPRTLSVTLAEMDEEDWPHQHVGEALYLRPSRGSGCSCCNPRSGIKPFSMSL